MMYIVIQFLLYLDTQRILLLILCIKKLLLRSLLPQGCTHITPNNIYKEETLKVSVVMI